MGLEINFYKDLSRNRDKLVYERVHKDFFDSDTLFEELVWCGELSGKGDESGLISYISLEQLREIFEENSGELEEEMSADEYRDLVKITQLDEDYLLVRISH